MKSIRLAATYLLVASSVSRADVLISQYYEGASFNKYIELHNPSAAPVTMTGYMLTLWTLNASGVGAGENWKSDGATPSQAYDLSAVTLPAGGYFLLSHFNADAPGYANANVRNSNLINFNGNDSVVLYKSNTYTVANILDAVSFTAANEGQDKSFYRLTNDVGYNTVVGESILAFPAVWGEKTLADVLAATPADAWYLTGQTATTSPVLDSFTIASDAATTSVRGVALTFTASGASATEYLFSEDIAFAGSVWQPFAAVPKVFLSGGSGVKTVYFKLRNAGGDSGVLNDTIELTSYTFPAAVVLTQYYEGTSNNKHIEIANLSAAPVDLATWNIARWTNQEAENWKYTGTSTGGTSQTIALSAVNTDGLGSTTLAPGAVIVISHSDAAGPAGAAVAALSAANLSHNGNDSVALYSGPVNPANLADVVSFTELGNEGQDKSFVRLTSGQGFSFGSGSKITDFAAVWQEVFLATADTAVAGQNEHLGTYPGGGGYDAWAASFGLTGTPEDDGDEDGASNLLEYASGTRPNNGASVPESLLTVIGPTLTVTWGRSAAAFSDPRLTWTVEASTSMAEDSWSAAGVSNVQPSANSISADYAISPGTPRVFLRLKIVLAP